MSWTDDLLGIPYRERGRAPTIEEARACGVCCAGLTILARFVRTGERMPDTGIDITANLRAAVGRAAELMNDPTWMFRKVGEHEPEEMDIVVMLRATDFGLGERMQPLHVGTWIAGGNILHVQSPAPGRIDTGSCLVSSRHPDVKRRIVGFARWKSA